VGLAFIGEARAREMSRSWKRPTLEDAGRNSNYGFSPTTFFGFWPAKMCEMLSRVIMTRSVMDALSDAVLRTAMPGHDKNSRKNGLRQDAVA
jgi:hypothetical protein